MYTVNVVVASTTAFVIIMEVCFIIADLVASVVVIIVIERNISTTNA